MIIQQKYEQKYIFQNNYIKNCLFEYFTGDYVSNLDPMEKIMIKRAGVYGCSLSTNCSPVCVSSARLLQGFVTWDDISSLRQTILSGK